MSAKIRKGRQQVIAKRDRGAIWFHYMTEAQKSIAGSRGFRVGRGAPDALEQIAAQIVKSGNGVKFLASVRRGRPTAVQNIRYRLLREVEKTLGDQAPRRRPDANTPDALALKPVDAGPLFAHGAGVAGA